MVAMIADRRHPDNRPCPQLLRLPTERLDVHAAARDRSGRRSRPQGSHLRDPR